MKGTISVWQWIDKVSPETSFRAMRVVSRALGQEVIVAKWRQSPTLLGLLVERSKRDPDVVIGGPDAIEKIIRNYWRSPAVQTIRGALDALWNDPRREESSFALVVWQTDGLFEMVAMDVRPALGVTLHAKPAPRPADSSPEELRRWLRKRGETAIERVGGPNMRACAARDEVAIVAVEADGTLGYGYAPRAEYLADFPEPPQLRPGETAACHAILLDMGAAGDVAPYEPFRMCSVAARHERGRG